MSWNIQDSKGDGFDKFQNDDFMKILEKGNIICLQETKKQIKVEGYMGIFIVTDITIDSKIRHLMAPKFF